MKAALVYAQLGWRVIPLHDTSAGTCSCSKGAECRSAGKHPRLSDWPAQATTDPAVIAEWWRQWPEANLGLATGSASGVWALDVDPRHGGDDTLAQLLEEHGPLPVTTQAATPSGGTHYLFRMPGHPVTNAPIGKGLDIRGDGGQIVAAPSHTTGPYRWVRPPWETPPADAPAWLLERLRRRTVPTPSAPASRGYFPPASAEVLQAAREALAEHGPAIDGDAGGLHTVQAAAILTHDFALEDEEAWPLFLEWNQTCVPPWEEDELRERLRRGRKYGKQPYGCRRPQDAVEAARKLIEEWQQQGGHEESLHGMVALVRPLMEGCGDSVRHALIERMLRHATGLGGRALKLPRLAPPALQLRRGQIQVTTHLAEVADEALKAIAPRVFSRNGVLCEVVTGERTWIHELEPAGILYLLSKAAEWVRQDESKGAVTQAPPKDVAQILAARRDLPGVRMLEAVTASPVFLADGSILQTRGYNAEARLYLEPNVEVDVPSYPTREEAAAAVEMLRDLVSDFRFLTPADFSSWCAALMSPLVKSATRNAPAPLTCISASSPGAGKTLLADLIARVVTGSPAEVRQYNPHDAAEHQKRLTAFVRAGSPVNIFDNINGRFGDEALDKLITSSTWSDRILGASEAPPLPVVSTWIATGNNISPEGDTVRRVLIVRLDVREERPQERTGFKRPLLVEYALEHRAELLEAALTILRAFHIAGRPAQGLTPWGSFTAWSGLVREALVWAGCADPYETQRRAAAELTEEDGDRHDFWLAIVGESDGTPASIVLLANQRDVQGQLGLREPLTPARLRGLLARYVDKPRSGKAIRRSQGQYFVEKLK